jgi:hypothetical protein
VLQSRPGIYRSDKNIMLCALLSANVQFMEQDMMTADVSHADIVVLTSMCWDLDTRKKVAAKVRTR